MNSKVMRSVTFAALAAALVASPLAALAKDVNPQQQRLEAAQDQLAAKASATKGAAEQEFLRKKQRIDALIGDLEAGRRVDPSEIDKALEGADQPF